VEGSALGVSQDNIALGVGIGAALAVALSRGIQKKDEERIED